MCLSRWGCIFIGLLGTIHTNPKRERGRKAWLRNVVSNRPEGVAILLAGAPIAVELGRFLSSLACRVGMLRHNDCASVP